MQGSSREIRRMKSKIKKIFLNEFGSFIAAKEGCLQVRNKNGKLDNYPLFENEVGEVQARMGNTVSVGALATCSVWGIDFLVLAHTGKPIAYLRSLEDDSHVTTRVAQYEALKSNVGIDIAKKIVYSRILGQNEVLKKYCLRQHDIMRVKETIDRIDSDKLSLVRKQLLSIEGRCTDFYFHQIFQLLPKTLMIDRRRTYKAYDGINNIFNLCYTVLKWKVHLATVKSKLEPFLGFLHSEQFSKPSLVCDLMETYRCLIEDFIIANSKNLRKKDFEMKKEDFNSKITGLRQFLDKPSANEWMAKLNSLFESKVEVSRVNRGNRQEIESPITEEALQLAKYLRKEKKEWAPRVPML